MKVEEVRKCSEQLKRMLAEQHSALDARVRQQIAEVIEALDKAAKEGDGTTAMSKLVNLLHTATNIAYVISKIRND